MEIGDSTMNPPLTHTRHPIPTIQACLQRARHRLAPHTETPALDAQVLLAHLLRKPRAWLLAHPEAPLPSGQLRRLENALTRLESGLPLPYLLGEWEFYGLTFTLTPAVLIPRPETELLVETALNWLRQHPDRRRAADVGTGCGCIAVTLAAHCPDLRLTATDISRPALAVARQNARRHRLASHIHFLHADLLSLNRQPATFDLICANLPYIPTPTLRTLDVYGREPTLALDGGPDGLALFRRFLPQAAAALTPGGLLLLEIEATLPDQTRALARQHFPAASIEIRPDLAGRDRLLLIQT